MAVKKSTKKAGAKKASPKKKASGKRTATAKKAGAGAKKGSPASKPVPTEKAEKKAKGKVSSMSVNLGQIFSLRPRVSTTFRQADFLTARLRLQDEAYANIEKAARAVAEKALELTHEGPLKRGFKPGR